MKWTYSLGLGTVVDMLRSGIGCHYPGDFAVYTLPDALYCLAYVLIMMWEGKIILDIQGEEKKKLTVKDLLDKFEEASGEEFSNDSALLS